MSRNASGVYSLVAGNPVSPGTVIDPAWANNTLTDIANALTDSIAKTGVTTPTANLPMGGFIFTGGGSPAANGDGLVWGQAASLLTVVTPAFVVPLADIDLNSGTYAYRTCIVETINWTISNPPVASMAFGFILELINGGLATHNWPASVKWQYGINPTFRTAATDIVVMVTRDGGVTWRALLAIANTATT